MKRLSLTAARTRSSRSVDSTTTCPASACSIASHGTRSSSRVRLSGARAITRPLPSTTTASDSERSAACDAQQLVKRRWVAHQRRRVAVEVVGHGEGFGADALPMLLEIGLRHRAGGLDRSAHPLAEPGLDAEVEEQRREHRHQDRRRHRDQAEQHDDPHVQPRTGKAAAALGPYPDELVGRRSHPAASSRTVSR